MAFGSVHAVSAACVAGPGDDIPDQRIDDRAFGLDRHFVFTARGTHADGQVIGLDIGQRGLNGLPEGSREGLELEEIAEVGLFDGLQGGGFPCVADRGEAIFDPAGVSVTLQQGVDGASLELGQDGVFRAGSEQQTGTKQQDKSVFHSE